MNEISPCENNHVYNTPLPLLKTKINPIFKQNVGIQILPVCILIKTLVYIYVQTEYTCAFMTGTIDVVKVYILTLLYTLKSCCMYMLLNI